MFKFLALSTLAGASLGFGGNHFILATLIGDEMDDTISEDTFFN